MSKSETIQPAAAGRRRRFASGQKRAILDEAARTGNSISEVARRYGLAPSMMFQWRRAMDDASKWSPTSRCHSPREGPPVPGSVVHVAEDGGFDLSGYPGVTPWIARVGEQSCVQPLALSPEAESQGRRRSPA